MADRDTGDPHDPKPSEAAELERERHALLQTLEDALETPMVVLAFVWLTLLVAELVWGELRAFALVGTVIWIVFIVDFAVKLVLAPRKLVYVRRNWLVAISLAIPALRILRIARVIRLLQVARVGRGLHLVRVVSSLNRGMRALRATLGRRGFGYIAALTALVVFGGAAGMYAFESETPGGLHSYGEALWFTTMIITMLGSQFWPETFEGRVLSVILSMYAIAIFGYLTATLASYFIGRDAESGEAELAGAQALAEIRRELVALRAEVGALARRGPLG